MHYSSCEDDDALNKLHDDDDAFTTDDEDILICEINTHAEPYIFCRAKAAHDAVLRKVDASFAKKLLTATEAPHLNAKPLSGKLDDIAKTVDLDIPWF